MALPGITYEMEFPECANMMPSRGSGSLLKAFCLYPDKETFCEAYESVEVTENDYKTNRLLILEGGDHHGKDKNWENM
jgi:hypothetical protein